MSKFHLVWLGVILVGCGQYPDPNNLEAVSPESRAEIANKRLESAGATLQFKVEQNEISDQRRNQLIRELAEDMLKKVDPKAVPDSDQWMYAALLRVTDRWPDAESALRIAVKVAPDEDRRVNDSLKLAQAMAKNKNVTEALVIANSVMNAADADAAPILPAVLLEIVPAAQGQGHDKEFAELLVKAIECHKRVKVDLTSDAGKSFVIASRYHIHRAQAKIEELNGSKI
jgi:hypothetical protein